MNDYFEQFFSENSDQFSVIIENDGRACYGYLLRDKQIVGDIWLYNQDKTPDQTDWSKREQLPFLNPEEYAKGPGDTITILTENDVHVQWLFADDTGGLDQVEVYIRGELSAILKENSKPGWSSNAKKDGPLANVLTSDTVPDVLKNRRANSSQ